MKKLFLLLLVLAGCAGNPETRVILSLEGEWQFSADSLDKGIAEQWYSSDLNESIKLPGSMAENGKGDDVTVGTDWTGQIVDRSWYTDKRYEKYRQPGNIKIPFWLTPVKTYKGAAWYSRNVDIPSGWEGKKIILFLEQCHWESKVYVNGKEAGSRNSLATPHVYDLTGLAVTGKNRISIRIDNRVIIPVGENSHSISDHTQSNWNGIAGKISLTALPEVSLGDITIYPDVKEKKARIIVQVENISNNSFKGKLDISAGSFNSSRSLNVKKLTADVEAEPGKSEVTIDYPMGRDPLLWSEFDPAMYRLSVTLKNDRRKIVDIRSEDFGMREFKASGTRFTINGTPVFLRGTTECCVFPLTGYPPSDTESWERVLRVCKDFGLNHMRFHSYCPPEAAFIAADRLGIYFHVECSAWSSVVGDSTSFDTFVYEESDNILRQYGNHPSFCMLAYGNEPGGRHPNAFLARLTEYWKAKDNRRVYTCAAGWPLLPESDYHLNAGPRIQQWGAGLKSIINSQPPQSRYDFREFLSRYDKPFVSHEAGQWCVYPDFGEIGKYKGPLKATNFEIFRETLTENHMGDQAEDFLNASGKLQVLCYKAEIEAALRSPGFAGFQILQLHDFPGQGTALVGFVNPFFEPKSYITAGEFRMFCNTTVPLARMDKMTWTTDETFSADLELSHFGEKPLSNVMVVSRIKNEEGKVVYSDSTLVRDVPLDNCISAGTVKLNLGQFNSPQKLVLETSLGGTPFRNAWDFWVYPASGEAEKGDVLVTGNLDREAADRLAKGGKVLLLINGKVGKTKGADIAIGFSRIFWNTAWTRNQAPHTLGILCDPAHPVFREFPTEYHSNWQWWDPVSHSQAIIINDFPADLKPLIQPIDTWFENRRLALAFESLTGGGRLLVCSIDLEHAGEDRPSSRQLYLSMLKYMNSEAFNPQIKVDADKIAGLMR